MKKENVERKRRQILETIIKYHPKGRSTHELQSDVALTHETIYTHCQELIKQGFIYNKPKKHGRYTWTGKIPGDPTIKASIFANKTIKKILNWQHWIFEENKLYNNNFIDIDKILANPNTDSITEKQKDEITLFEFANRIAALILYVLIEAMIPEKTTFGISGLEGQKEQRLTGSQKDELTFRWIEKVINSRIILWQFRQMHPVKRGLKPFTGLNDKRRWSMYSTMNEQNYSKLVEVYKSLYPNLYKELERIKGNKKYAKLFSFQKVYPDSKKYAKWISGK